MPPAAQLALSDIELTSPDGTKVPHAHLLVREGRLRVRAEGITDISVFGVTAIDRVSKDVYSITTEGGVYLAQAKGCGCS